MKLRGCRVVVVGGAVAGASTALFLTRAGAYVTLLERAARARAVGAGIALAENGLAVLDALGLSQALERVGHNVAGVRVVDAQGRTLFTPRGLDQGLVPRLLMVRRSHLYELLTAAVAKESRIETRFGFAVSAVDTKGQALGTQDGKQSVLSADLIVGADGVHSRVRDSQPFGARVQRTGISYARGLAAAGLARNEEAWTSSGLFGSFAVPNGTYWYASLGTAVLRRAMSERDLPRLCHEWTRAYPHAAPLLSSLTSFEQLLINEVVRVRCKRYHVGRSVLVGDAAHAMAPNLGQGANSALVDAAVLASELTQCADVPSALLRYQQRRLRKVEAVCNAAARLGLLAEWTHPALCLVRDRLIMPLAQRQDPRDMLQIVWQEEPALLRNELGRLGLARAA